MDHLPLRFQKLKCHLSQEYFEYGGQALVLTLQEGCEGKSWRRFVVMWSSQQKQQKVQLSLNPTLSLIVFTYFVLFNWNSYLEGKVETTLIRILFPPLDRNSFWHRMVWAQLYRKRSSRHANWVALVDCRDSMVSEPSRISRSSYVWDWFGKIFCMANTSNTVAFLKRGKKKGIVLK